MNCRNLLPSFRTTITYSKHINNARIHRCLILTLQFFSRGKLHAKGRIPISTRHFNVTIHITRFITHSLCICQEKMQEISSGKKKNFFLDRGGQPDRVIRKLFNRIARKSLPSHRRVFRAVRNIHPLSIGLWNRVSL
jgi:hypothetical protein